MKRSSGLVRRTRLRSSTPLKRTGQLKPRSAKQIQIDGARRVLRKRLMAEDELCRRCRCRFGVLLHEVLRRSQGGDPTSELVAVLLCWQCHDEIHARPQLARETGWLVYRRDLLGLEAA